ncbi:hypothetical protein XELAEV_18015981mg [Xenopus laevis]|uniref:Uncharacterized protein n=1 Tax=Xenopus laevis TaxID=8355 RepID=A0A974HWG6_XENLA|nr:hypothetical protein XELAEV_18015981mg [Xenopus laevis]
MPSRLHTVDHSISTVQCEGKDRGRLTASLEGVASRQHRVTAHVIHPPHQPLPALGDKILLEPPRGLFLRDARHRHDGELVEETRVEPVEVFVAAVNLQPRVTGEESVRDVTLYALELGLLRNCHTSDQLVPRPQWSYYRPIRRPILGSTVCNREGMGTEIRNQDCFSQPEPEFFLKSLCQVLFSVSRVTPQRSAACGGRTACSQETVCIFGCLHQLVFLHSYSRKVFMCRSRRVLIRSFNSLHLTSHAVSRILELAREDKSSAAGRMVAFSPFLKRTGSGVSVSYFLIKALLF